MKLLFQIIGFPLRTIIVVLLVSVAFIRCAFRPYESNEYPLKPLLRFWFLGDKL